MTAEELTTVLNQLGYTEPREATPIFNLTAEDLENPIFLEAYQKLRLSCFEREIGLYKAVCFFRDETGKIDFIAERIDVPRSLLFRKLYAFTPKELDELVKLRKLCNHTT